ncbi:MAG: hypothetical protein MAG453_01472 [Calditrichaeota bacterium]|nr:hypothetical protein [Calditrichota bacterium]
MAWIRVIDERDAGGELKRAYDRVAGKRGRLSNVLKIQSLHPRSVTAHLDLYTTLMFEREHLSREQCELIGVAVSATNRCPYCVRHHSEALNKYWRDHNRTASYAIDPGSFPLPAKERAIVDYAIRLTRAPGEMRENDVRSLRDAGLSDTQILLVNQITSYFNYVNRSVLGLGVEIEPDTGGFEY